MTGDGVIKDAEVTKRLEGGGAKIQNAAVSSVVEVLISDPADLYDVPTPPDGATIFGPNDIGEIPIAHESDIKGGRSSSKTQKKRNQNESS